MTGNPISREERGERDAGAAVWVVRVDTLGDEGSGISFIIVCKWEGKGIYRFIFK